MASPVAWAGKKQARMAPTPSCACAQLTSRGPALKSSRMTGRPAAAGTRGVTTSPVPNQLHGMGHAWDPTAGRCVPFPCPGPAGPAPGDTRQPQQSPTCPHGVLQQLQLVAWQRQVPPVLCLRLHIYPCTGSQGTTPYTPSPRVCAPGAVPLPSAPPLPVPRHTSTTSAPRTASSTSAREYCWHRGCRHPAAKLTLAGSICSPLLRQGTAGSGDSRDGAPRPQGRAEPARGVSSTAGSPGCVDVPRLRHRRVVPKKHPGIVREGAHHLRGAEGGEDGHPQPPATQPGAPQRRGHQGAWSWPPWISVRRSPPGACRAGRGRAGAACPAGSSAARSS